jgi:hypothetical protein
MASESNVYESESFAYTRRKAATSTTSTRRGSNTVRYIPEQTNKTKEKARQRGFYTDCPNIRHSLLIGASADQSASNPWRLL